MVPPGVRVHGLAHINVGTDICSVVRVRKLIGGRRNVKSTEATVGVSQSNAQLVAFGHSFLTYPELVGFWAFFKNRYPPASEVQSRLVPGWLAGR